jgi:glycogen synthase
MKKKRKLDVLIVSRVYPPEGGGVSTHVFYLADALSQITRSQHDHRRVCFVRVVTAMEARSATGRPPNLIICPMSGEKGHFDTTGDIPFQKAITYLQNTWWNNKPDVVHAHDFESLQIAMIVKAAFEVPVILTVHKTPKEWDHHQPQRDPKDAFLQAVLRFGFVDRLVAPSTACERRLLAQGFPEHKIRRIPHGVPAKLSSWPNIKNVLDRFNLEVDQELVLCPSRLDPHKGLEAFVSAAAILGQRLPNRNLVFAIAGAGAAAYRTQLEEHARREGIERAMRFGPSDGVDLKHTEMPTLYRRAKICVLPSRRENFPQVLLEAFMFRRPVVAANTGGIPDIVQAEETGLLCHRDDPDDLASQMQRLIEDNALAQFLTAQAHRKVLTDFAAGNMAAAYFRLYKDVASISIE